MASNSHKPLPVVELKQASKTYPGTSCPAVNELSFCLKEGEIISILGPSGCGKTTILRLIAGFEIPDTGEVYLRDSRAAGNGSSVPPEKRGVAMVFQDYALFPHLFGVQEHRLWAEEDEIPGQEAKGRGGPGDH